MRAWCERCGDPIFSADQVEVRTEYRLLRGGRRLRIWRERLICRTCALAEWEAHDRPRGHQREAHW